MASLMQCDIVTPEESIFSGQVSMVSLVGSLGELGILPGHMPLMTGIRPGPLRLKMESGEEEVFFASDGFLEVQPGHVTALIDTAIRAEDLDESAAEEAERAAKAALGGESGEFEFSAAAAQLAEAAARMRTLDELRKRRNR
ncbi:MAG: F0F1 ATP synthase subunit epsilon [Gammaproteobacteria bacterium]|nr:F0F1 ATP synthase subunit epsilon [Gammaproteobacteria bacterium]MCY4323982.1 F0F1 ATP synthase subunit epsilon [Gammaproteobacteria bacterium]